MNARSQFDAGPLSWVKGEIDQAMRAGADALVVYSAHGHSVGVLGPTRGL